MCFIAVFAQELISGKGVIQGIQEGDVFNLACLGATVLTILGLTVFLAIKGEDSYVDKMMGRK
jgi:hypothetical protein